MLLQPIGMELDFFEENFFPNKKTHSYKGPLIGQVIWHKRDYYKIVNQGWIKKRLKVFLYALNVLERFKTVFQNCFKTVCYKICRHCCKYLVDCVEETRLSGT